MKSQIIFLASILLATSAHADDIQAMLSAFAGPTALKKVSSYNVKDNGILYGASFRKIILSTPRQKYLKLHP